MSATFISAAYSTYARPERRRREGRRKEIANAWRSFPFQNIVISVFFLLSLFKSFHGAISPSLMVLFSWKMLCLSLAGKPGSCRGDLCPAKERGGERFPEGKQGCYLLSANQAFSDKLQCHILQCDHDQSLSLHYGNILEHGSLWSEVPKNTS